MFAEIDIADTIIAREVPRENPMVKMVTKKPQERKGWKVK